MGEANPSLWNNISFGIQNCNSLNVTGLSKNCETKIAAITNCGTDIIFLSDTRLTNCSGVKNDERISNYFRDSPRKSYFSIFNSSKNGRGVGILISNSLKFTILDKILDPEENFLLLKITINDITAIIGAIYGPNQTDRPFFSNIQRSISNLMEDHEYPIILGGDWNTTWENLPVGINIDIMNMANVPNHTNSMELNRLTRHLKLTDPYRVIYPTKRDYTYTPFGTIRLNRSRLDFFVISESLAASLHDCYISSTNTCNLLITDSLV